ncbi:MAG: alpha/beta fold hydrolase [Acidimicrobiales bacterium]
MSEPAAAELHDLDELAPRHDVPRLGRSGFTLVEGRQVHYLEWGRRDHPPVLCLHGGGQTAYMYEELGAALAPRHQVLAPDLPNHGDSDPIGAAAAGPATPLDRQALAASLPPLCDAFGFDRMVVVGASLGGITAITVGAARPDMVAGIVLIDVGHRLEDEGVRKIIDFMRAHESFASLDEAAAEIGRYLPRRKEVRPASLTRNLRQRPDGRWVWKHGFGRRFAQLAAADPGGDRYDWRTSMQGLESDAARLECPVLVLRGAESDVLSEEGAQEVAEVIPDARLKRVLAAGHLAAGDNPESTVTLVSGFLDEIGW